MGHIKAQRNGITLEILDVVLRKFHLGKITYVSSIFTVPVVTMWRQTKNVYKKDKKLRVP